MCNKTGRQINADESADHLRETIARQKKVIAKQADRIHALAQDLRANERELSLLRAQVDYAHKYAIGYEI